VLGRLLTRLMDAQTGWAGPLGDFNHRWLSALFRPIRPVQDVLHGTWLGHPVHAAITDIPIGVLTVSLLLDVLGQPAAADIALVLGILAMLGAAVTGAADYTTTDGSARVRATVHSAVMVVALGVYVVSMLLRWGGSHGAVPIALSLIGYLLLTLGAFVGGDVVYVLGNMVSRHAFRGGGTKWIRLEVDGGVEPDAMPEATPMKAKLGINTLVLVRAGSTVHALHDTCAHAGGPLSGGKVVDGCIECPWHASRFRLSDGHLTQGPTVYDQPVYEVRRGEAGWEARRAG
jgi:nitrite reductase/ring-hydroxylating ferredoxin subunit